MKKNTVTENKAEGTLLSQLLSVVIFQSTHSSSSVTLFGDVVSVYQLPNPLYHIYWLAVALEQCSA